jgi:hypothetical protein
VGVRGRCDEHVIEEVEVRENIVAQSALSVHGNERRGIC